MPFIALGLAAAVTLGVAGSTVPPSTPPTGLTRTGRIAAVTGDGDAVLLASVDPADTTEPHLLLDGTDPDEEPPAEGPTTFIDGAALDADAETAFVGTCCEPVSGSTYLMDIAGGELDPLFGSAPTLSPDGSALALTSYFSLFVVDAETREVATIETPGFSPWDVGWAGTDLLATYGATDTQTYEIRLYDRLNGTLLATAPATVEQFAPWLVAIVGVDTDGALVVLDQPQEGGPTSLHRLELPTLAPLDDRDPLPDGVLSASLSGDGQHLLWVDADRAMHIDEGPAFPGEYIWADWA